MLRMPQMLPSLCPSPGLTVSCYSRARDASSRHRIWPNWKTWCSIYTKYQQWTNWVSWPVNKVLRRMLVTGFNMRTFGETHGISDSYHQTVNSMGKYDAKYARSCRGIWVPCWRINWFVCSCTASIIIYTRCIWYCLDRYDTHNGWNVDIARRTQSSQGLGYCCCASTGSFLRCAPLFL